MFNKLFVVCLLLAVAAELIEGKSASHKRKVQRNPVRGHFQIMKRQSQLPECGSDHFLCVDQSRCISDKWVCDGDNDCVDGSDEPGDCLTRECPEGYVKCSNGQCLNITSHCTGEARCRGESTVMSDVDCPLAECQSDQFACASLTRCIPQSYVCDRDSDCGDRSDEQNCEERVCADDELRCNSGQCINKLSYCVSGWSSPSCRDDTDIDGACLDFPCPPEGDYFKCQSNGKCISNSSRCDGYENCADGSDEADCPPVQCDSGYDRCPTKNKCINKRYFCDTDNDCGDNSDESPELCYDRKCDEDEISCANGQCLSKEGFCQGDLSCRDGSRSSSDTTICQLVQCDSGYARCANVNKCINTRYFCDTDNDCGDNSDEAPELCSTRVCTDNEITCANGQCIPSDGFCREEFSCRDKSRSSNDLTLCKPIECESDHTKCPNRNKCIRSRYFCDTDNDCGDNSDEAPELCNNRVCDENEVSCANGQCISIEDFCSGNTQCRDSSQPIENNPACRDYQSQPLPKIDFLAEYLCEAGLREACGVPDIDQEFGAGPSVGDAFAKLAQVDLRKICTPIQEWRDCALAFFNSSQHCQDADQLVPDQRLKREYASKALDYVCEENIEVINREKSCLLKLNEQDQPVMMFKLMMSCAPHIIALQSSSSQDEFCLPVELQQCAKNVIAEECGDDIAIVANGLADLAQDFCKQMQTSQSVIPTNQAEQPSFPTSMKRHTRDFMKMRKMLKSIF